MREGREEVAGTLLLSVASVWLTQVDRSTVCADACFIRSAFRKTLVRALNPDGSSSHDCHRGCIFNYSLVEVRLNGGGGSPFGGEPLSRSCGSKKLLEVEESPPA